MVMLGNPWELVFPSASAGDDYRYFFRHWGIRAEGYYVETLIVILLALAALVGYAWHSRRKNALSRETEKKESEAKRHESVKMIRNMILENGGSRDDSRKMEAVFSRYSYIDPGHVVADKRRFRNLLKPLIIRYHGHDFAQRMEQFCFPPAKKPAPPPPDFGLDDFPTSVFEACESGPSGAASAMSSTTLDMSSTAIYEDADGKRSDMLELMDATLKPGLALQLSFAGLIRGCESQLIGHNRNGIWVKLPSGDIRLRNSIRHGIWVEGSFATNSSRLAFSSEVMEVTPGNPPVVRLDVWKDAWELGNNLLLVRFSNSAMAVEMLENVPIVAGSDPNCDIVISFPGIAPRHAAFINRGNLTGVKPLSDDIPVLRNSLAISHSQALADGDIVRIGNCEVQFKDMRAVAARMPLPESVTRIFSREETAQLVASDAMPILRTSRNAAGIERDRSRNEENAEP